MQIVIDIPEKIYRELTETAIIVTEVYPSTIERALTESTPYEERKTGKWIDHSEEGYVECPLCSHLTTCEGNKEDLHYCFWCGAKMEADE